MGIEGTTTPQIREKTHSSQVRDVVCCDSKTTNSPSIMQHIKENASSWEGSVIRYISKAIENERNPFSLIPKRYLKVFFGSVSFGFFNKLENALNYTVNNFSNPINLLSKWAKYSKYFNLKSRSEVAQKALNSGFSINLIKSFLPGNETVTVLPDFLLQNIVTNGEADKLSDSNFVTQLLTLGTRCDIGVRDIPTQIKFGQLTRS